MVDISFTWDEQISSKNPPRESFEEYHRMKSEFRNLCGKQKTACYSPLASQLSRELGFDIKDNGMTEYIPTLRPDWGYPKTFLLPDRDRMAATAKYYTENTKNILQSKEYEYVITDRLSHVNSDMMIAADYEKIDSIGLFMPPNERWNVYVWKSMQKAREERRDNN